MRTCLKNTPMTVRAVTGYALAAAAAACAGAPPAVEPLRAPLAAAPSVPTRVPNVAPALGGLRETPGVRAHAAREEKANFPAAPGRRFEASGPVGTGSGKRE